MQYMDPSLAMQLQPKYGQVNGYANGQLIHKPVPTEQALRPIYKESDYIRFFKFYGLSLSLVGKQLNGECPFKDCRRTHHDSPDHFFASPANGCWDCKYCGRRGTTYDFIRQFHADALSSTTTQDYEELAKARLGCPSGVFPIFQVARNPLNKEWLLPSFSLKTQEMTNLYAWKQQATPNGPTMTVMSGPSFKQILYGLQFFRREMKRPLIILEGHWDMMAMYANLYQLGLLDSYDLIATPGDKFPEVDIHLLSNRVIIHQGDNDVAGERSFENLLNQLGLKSIQPKQIYRMAFNMTEKSGMDTRDILASQPSPQQGWEAIYKRYYEVKPDFSKYANAGFNPSLTQTPCDNFDDVADCLVNGGVYMPDCLRDSFAVIVGLAATTSLGGHPLWCYQVGPSGGSKTIYLSMVSSADPYCFFLSKWTGLVSGYYQQGMGDLSLVPKVNNKCICIEDFTPILNETEQVQNRLYGELREAYGGKLSNYYRTPSGMKNFDDVKFNILACVTDRIRKINNTDLGERFLQCDQDSYWTEDGSLIRDGINRTIIVESSIKNALEVIASGKIDKYQQQRSVCWGFIEYIVRRLRDDPKWIHNKLAILGEDEETTKYYGQLAQWTAYARSFIDRGREKQPQYGQRVEFGSRLSGQLIKLAIVVSLVFDEEPNTRRVKGIVRKIALDTGFSYQQDMMLLLTKAPMGISVSDFERRTGFSNTTVLNRLRDLSDLNIIGSPSLPSVRLPGNQPHTFSLTPELQSIASTCGFVPVLPNHLKGSV